MTRNRISLGFADRVTTRRMASDRYGDILAHMEQMNLLSDPDRNTIGKFQRPTDAAETQRTAAVLAYPSTGTWRRKVLDAITVAGNHGMTDEQIQEALRMNPSTQRPRRVELVEGGWVMDSGRRRSTRSRRDAVVWVRA